VSACTKSASALLSPDKTFFRALALRKVNQALRDKHKTLLNRRSSLPSIQEWLMTSRGWLLALDHYLSLKSYTSLSNKVTLPLVRFSSSLLMEVFFMLVTDNKDNFLIFLHDNQALLVRQWHQESILHQASYQCR